MTDPLGGIRPGCWLRDANNPSLYVHYKGIAPDGTLRLLPLKRPPHGKTVHVLDNGKVTTERVPLELRASAKVLLGLLVAALIAAMILGSSEEYSGGGLIALGVAALLGLGVFLAQEEGLYPTDYWDDLEAERQAAEEYWIEQQRRADDMARNAQRQAAQMHQWQSAQWAQLAAINAALNPGQDVWRPYGQSPPMTPPM